MATNTPEGRPIWKWDSKTYPASGPVRRGHRLSHVARKALHQPRRPLMADPQPAGPGELESAVLVPEMAKSIGLAGPAGHQRRLTGRQSHGLNDASWPNSPTPASEGDEMLAPKRTLAASVRASPTDTRALVRDERDRAHQCTA